MALAPQLLSSRRSGRGIATSIGVYPALGEPSPRVHGGTARLLGALIENGLRPQHFAAAITLVCELDLVCQERQQDQAA
jgi:hypothetical protein